LLVNRIMTEISHDSPKATLVVLLYPRKTPVLKSLARWYGI